MVGNNVFSWKQNCGRITTVVLITTVVFFFFFFSVILIVIIISIEIIIIIIVITINFIFVSVLILQAGCTCKIACLCYHCHSSTAPSYVTDMLHKKPLHTRNTRSSSYNMPLLNRPARSKATLGDRSFSFASSSVWNSIPNDVRCVPSLSSFKCRLKTYLFRSAYKD